MSLWCEGMWKMSIPIGTAVFQSWDFDALQLMCRPVSSSIDMVAKREGF